MLANRQFHLQEQPKGEVDSSFDREHFERQTFGDRSLQREIIGLFLAQVANSRNTLIEPMTTSAWRYLTHTLKGAASAVGATQIAALASEWELAGSPRDADARHVLVQAFDTAQTAFQRATAYYLD
jgi:HPt (histidine-containing phosphotransfer) domain-containing protein